jgi:hypothetical protein
MSATGFFVWQKQNDYVTAGPDARETPTPYHRQNHRVHIFHIYGATTPDKATIKFGRKWRVAPLGGHCRHHVKMAVQEQRGRRRVRTGDPQIHPGAVLARGREHLRGPTSLAQALSAVIGCNDLAHCFGAFTPIAGVDLDQISQ